MGGTEYQWIPDVEPLITGLMDEIKAKAVAEMTEIDNIPILKLDLDELEVEKKSDFFWRMFASLFPLKRCRKNDRFSYGFFRGP